MHRRLNKGIVGHGARNPFLADGHGCVDASLKQFTVEEEVRSIGFTGAETSRGTADLKASVSVSASYALISVVLVILRSLSL